MEDSGWRCSWKIEDCGAGYGGEKMSEDRPQEGVMSVVILVMCLCAS
jgi:hypothetical protein